MPLKSKKIYALILIPMFFCASVYAGLIRFDLIGVKNVGTLTYWRHMEHSKDFKDCQPCHKSKIGSKESLNEEMTKSTSYIGCTKGFCHDLGKGHNAKKLKEMAIKSKLIKPQIKKD